MNRNESEADLVPYFITGVYRQRSQGYKPLYRHRRARSSGGSRQQRVWQNGRGLLSSRFIDFSNGCNRKFGAPEGDVQHLAIEAKIIKVTDYKEFMKYDILSTPGLVINEKLVSSGRIPGEAEITTFLTDALETA